ncbi:pyridoxamine 5'-phosphate oxidase family protein [Anaerosporobacter faecicola]|uniref:pyridoxamine 5'-phosphate oxidase family protein n=1 Tax=Anaerosporobacter faecicola TaxID=2718714 RepID=UPI00143AD14B|nr:pyridoxamine 5'-phosphate oxidase family protein [Anaerosporobacter faecicola]
MRRKDREVTDFKKIKEIIQKCDTIRLGLSDGLYPYVVPLSFGYEFVDEQIYFYIHGAMEGRKLDLMKKNGVCSFEMDCGHVMELMPKLKDVTMRYKCLM